MCYQRAPYHQIESSYAPHMHNIMLCIIVKLLTCVFTKRSYLINCWAGPAQICFQRPCTCMHVCVCVCVCVYICTCVCMHMCMQVCMLYSVVAVWRPCLCMSCWHCNYVMLCYCCLMTMLHVGLINSVALSCSIALSYSIPIVPVRLIIISLFNCYLQRSVEKFCMKRKHLKDYE